MIDSIKHPTLLFLFNRANYSDILMRIVKFRFEKKPEPEQMYKFSFLLAFALATEASFDVHAEADWGGCKNTGIRDAILIESTDKGCYGKHSGFSRGNLWFPLIKTTSVA